MVYTCSVAKLTNCVYSPEFNADILLNVSIDRNSALIGSLKQTSHLSRKC